MSETTNPNGQFDTTSVLSQWANDNYKFLYEREKEKRVELEARIHAALEVIEAINKLLNPTY